MTTTEETMMTDHTEMQIPGDILEAARKSFRLVANTYGNEDEMVVPIARAILKERERCARIADEYEKQLEGEANEWRADGMPMAAGQADAQAKASSAIAAKIRSVDK